MAKMKFPTPKTGRGGGGGGRGGAQRGGDGASQLPTKARGGIRGQHSTPMGIRLVRAGLSSNPTSSAGTATTAKRTGRPITAKLRSMPMNVIILAKMVHTTELPVNRACTTGILNGTRVGKMIKVAEREVGVTDE
jgi:hypothetical protein